MRSGRFDRGLIFNFLVCAASVAVLGVLVMQLWNALLPGSLAVPQITYWQAVGVLLLAHILLCGTPFYGLRARRRARYRRRLKERLAMMSREERAAINHELGLPRDSV